MKNIFSLLLLCSCFTQIALAQAPIPNGSFENWTGANPASWGTSDGVLAAFLGDPGGVERDTNGANVYDGTIAARITTKNINIPTIGAQNIPGVVSLGTLGLDFQTFTPEIAGLPYSDRPDSIRFAYKYAAASAGADSGAVIVTLTRIDGNGDQQFVANAFFQVGDAATYQVVTAKINYFTFFNPDTLLIQGISSASQNGLENSVMFLDDLGFVGLDTAFKAYINPFNSQSACEGDTVDFSTDEISGNTYLWHKDGAPLNNETAATFSTTTAGDYFVQVTRNSVVYNSDTISVTFSPLPTVTLALQDTACSNISSITFTGGSPAGGEYSGNGVTDDTFSPADAGNGSTTITYTYTDGNECSAEATDDIFVKVCTGIEVFIADVTVNIYPNPASNYLVFEVNDKLMDGKVQLMDASGKVVNTQTISNKYSHVNIQALPAGIYTAIIYTAKGEVAVSSTVSIVK
jgi:hypothetical protein